MLKYGTAKSSKLSTSSTDWNTTYTNTLCPFNQNVFFEHKKKKPQPPLPSHPHTLHPAPLTLPLVFWLCWILLTNYNKS